MYLTRNQAWWQHHRGFESLPLRHEIRKPCYQNGSGVFSFFDSCSHHVATGTGFPHFWALAQVLAWWVGQLVPPMSPGCSASQIAFLRLMACDASSGGATCATCLPWMQRFPNRLPALDGLRALETLAETLQRHSVAQMRKTLIHRAPHPHEAPKPVRVPVIRSRAQVGYPLASSAKSLTGAF